ncbi:MAG: hypothetical protein H6625_06050 [Bdellovibrionaceae bacterium]|nr:hypothetical protein [Pseudobdellovibrionaceae bacterium]
MQTVLLNSFLAFLAFIVASLGHLSISMAEKNPEDWKQESQEHRMRLLEYAQELKPHLREFHSHWNFFIKYMRLHDLPKIMELDEIKAVYPEYNHPQTIYERMANFHGIDEKDMTPEMRKDFNWARKDLNGIEAFLKAQFQQTVPMDTPDFTQVEMALDYIDSTIFRREELNIKSHEYGYYLAVVRFNERGQPAMANKAFNFLRILRSSIKEMLTHFPEELSVDTSLPFRMNQASTCELTLTYQ